MKKVKKKNKVIFLNEIFLNENWKKMIQIKQKYAQNILLFFIENKSFSGNKILLKNKMFFILFNLKEKIWNSFQNFLENYEFWLEFYVKPILCTKFIILLRISGINFKFSTSFFILFLFYIIFFFHYSKECFLKKWYMDFNIHTYIHTYIHICYQQT